MMTRPRILMLDEPAAGLNPKETEDLKALIALLRDEHGVTVLLIEHDMKLVMSISDHIYVINQGTPLANGSPEQVRNNPDVIKAYLGRREHADFRKRLDLLRQDPGPARHQRAGTTGEIVTLIGANGAGKSTLLMTLCGTPQAASGIRFQGEELVGQQTCDIMRKAIAVVPEGRRIFSRLTVEENLSMGASSPARRTSRSSWTRCSACSRG